MGLKRRLLTALLCFGLLTGASGCGREAGTVADQENARQGTVSEEGLKQEEIAQGASVLLSGSSASPVYSGDLRVDNGKDPYMAVVREKLEQLEQEDPEEYLEQKSIREDDKLVSKYSLTFIGTYIGGMFTKWFWRTGDDKGDGKTGVAAVDVYGAKAAFDADVKPYAADPDRTGMVVKVGGMAGRGGYVFLNLGYSAQDPEGVTIFGEGGKLLKQYEIPPSDGGIMADKDFNLYLVDSEICQVYSPEGELILEDDGMADRDGKCFTAFPDGTVGCFCYDYTMEGFNTVLVGSLYKIDLESGECVRLAKRTQNTEFLTCFDEDTLLWADENGIYRSDYEFQNAEPLYLWENHGLHIETVLEMCADPDGNISVIVRTTGKDRYYLHLAPTPEGVETVEIKFAVSERNRGQYLESVYQFNRDHPAYLINMEVYEEEAKLLTELTAGKGPVLVDTCVVQFAANKKLWENLEGKLAEWGLAGQLLEKPMLCGQIDGEQYGLVFSWDMYSFLTTCSEEESWDYEAFLSHVRGNDRLKKIFSEQTPQNLMDLFFLRSMEDSYFVDPIENKAHFDSEEFAEVAGIAKNLEVEDWPEERADVIPRVRSGRYLGDIAYLDSPQQIAYYREIYGEDVNFIGFPGREGSRHFLRTLEPVAVRSSASEEEKQVAFWFLSEMLGKDAQKGGTGYSVREDVFMEQLKEPENQSIYTVGGESFTVSADWEAVKEELLSIYEKALPEPVMPEGMRTAIEDELWECFYGTKSIEEVGKTLQNRVQLYLDEQN